MGVKADTTTEIYNKCHRSRMSLITYKARVERSTCYGDESAPPHPDSEAQNIYQYCYYLTLGMEQYLAGCEDAAFGYVKSHGSFNPKDSTYFAGLSEDACFGVPEECFDRAIERIVDENPTLLIRKVVEPSGHKIFIYTPVDGEDPVDGGNSDWVKKQQLLSAIQTSEVKSSESRTASKATPKTWVNRPGGEN